MFLGLYQNGAGETEKAARSVMIESPTGSGKSAIGILIARMLHDLAGAKVGWVAMRRNLLEQVHRENQKHGINVPLKTISMFEKNPPTDIDLLVVDECVPGDTLVDVIENGEKIPARMKDVVQHGIGSSILSYSGSGKLEYQPIISRSAMGVKELLEVSVEVEGVERILLITEEGKVWTEEGYKKPLNLVGNTILCKSSCCQTYLYEQQTARRSRTVQRDSTRETPAGSSLRLRMRRKSSLVPLQEKVQKIPLQSPSTERIGRVVRATTTNYSWDRAGRRIGRICLQSEDRSENQCSIENPSIHEKTIGVCPLETCCVGTAQQQTPDQGESRLRSGSRGVQHALPPLYPRSWESGLSTSEIDQPSLSGSTGCSGVCGLVDGRRFDNVSLYPRLHSPGEPDHHRLALGSLGDHGFDHDRQESSETNGARLSVTCFWVN